MTTLRMADSGVAEAWMKAGERPLRLLLVEDDIAAGRLVAPLGFVPDGSQYCLLAVQSWEAGSVQQLLVDWIQQQMQG